MKWNMTEWCRSLPRTGRPMPILSFPAAALLGVSVEDLLQDSEIGARGMAAVAERTDGAAAVSFMDLSVEAECFGAQVIFREGEVPAVQAPIWGDPSEEALPLSVPSVGSGRTGIALNTVRRAKEIIADRPVFGGMIGPFSLAARLFGVTESMTYCYDEPEEVHRALECITLFLAEYARAMKAAGADGILLAEPVAGLLSPALEEEFSSPYVKRIVEAVQDESFAVIYHNCGGSVPRMLPSLLGTGAAAYHFGNSVDLKKDILEKVPEGTLVMGNLDPVDVLWRGTPEGVRAATLALLGECAPFENFVLSSGCDMPARTPWENIDAFFGTAAEYFGRGCR